MKAVAKAAETAPAKARGDNLMIGQIVKGIGGFYYVKTPYGIFECRGRGALKSKGMKLQVGDRVDISEVELSREARDRGYLHEGVIEKIHERKNEFLRPPIVNVDMICVTFAGKDPEPAFSMIDKFILASEVKDTEALVVINKCDLLTEEEREAMKAISSGAYRVIETSCVTGEGLDELKEILKGKVVAFAGPSGAGKSTLVNSIVPEADMETGSISLKTQRGRHTTRHVEILEAEGGGLVYDTPGFTSFDIPEIEEDELRNLYPEIEKLNGQCRYDNCRHLKEPGCAVKEAVKAGKISAVRYASYKTNMKEIREKRKY